MSSARSIRIAATFCAAATLLALPLPSGGQWRNLGGPGGCHIQALVANGSYLFVGTAFGIFVSIDEGGTWAVTGEVGSAALGDASVSSLFASGMDLFALTPRGIFRSADGGAGWSALNTGLPKDADVQCLLEAESVLYCGLWEGGIFRSTDRGGHWMPAGQGLPGDAVVVSLAAMGQVLYAGFLYDKNVYSSTDGGITWGPMDPELPDDARAPFIVVSGGRLVAGSSGDGIFAIEDGGAAWTKIGADWSKDGGVTFLFASGQSLLAGVDDLAFLSTDSGLSWKRLEFGAAGEDLLINGFAASGPRLFVGIDGSGLFRSDDLGVTWVPVNAGFPTQADITGIARTGPDLFVATRTWGASGSVYVRTEGGAGWEAAGLTLPGETDINCLEAVGTSLLAGTDAGIFLSDDRGRTWSLVTPQQDGPPWVNCFEIEGIRIFAGTQDGIWLSTDRGRTWKKNFPLPDESARTECFVGVGKALFAGGSWGILVSRDYGETWSKVNAGLPLNASCVSLATDGRVIAAGITPPEEKDSEVDAQGDPVIVFDYPKYAIFLSEDGGQSWMAGVKGLPETYKVSRLAASGSSLIAALEEHYLKAGRHCLGLFHSTDGGKTWTPEWPGQWAAAPINCFVVDKDEILAGTAGAGVWQLPLAALKKRAP